MTKPKYKSKSQRWSPERKAAAADRMRARAEEAHEQWRKASAARKQARGAFPAFARTSLTIRPKTGDLIRLELNKVQQDIHLRAERQREKTGKVRMLVLKARQPGISTYVEARFFWRAIKGKGLRAFILTHEEPASNNLFAMAKRFYEHCPAKGRPKLTMSNVRELKFGARDCSYRVGTAGTEGIGRSETIQLFHGSEVAHWPNADSHMAGVLQAVPDADGTEVWLESTAYGPNGLFYTMCMRAKEGVGPYELIFIPWFAHGEYFRVPPGAWEPEDAWRAYGAEHGISRSKLYWAWLKNAELANASAASTESPCWLFRQEYPATVDDAFQTSGGKAFLAAEMVEAAIQACFPEESGAPLIFGVDIARGGADRTHIIDRRGRRLGHTVNESIDEDNEMVIAGRLARLIELHRPVMVFVDTTGGYGGGVVDRLREQGFAMVRGVNFGMSALDTESYANRRAEMWATMRAWLLAGADIVDDDVLRRHLIAPLDKLAGRGKLILEPKEEIRARLGLSPDRADAAALTFAEPVKARGPSFAPDAAESNYDMLSY